MKDLIRLVMEIELYPKNNEGDWRVLSRRIMITFAV